MILKLIWMFLKVGFLGFGGGYAMLSLIKSEAVLLGLTLDQFADMTVIDFLVPGPIAINSATYVGYILSMNTYGYVYLAFIGALIATLTVTIPSYLYAPTLINNEEKINKNIYLKNTLTVVKGAAIGLVAAVAFDIFIENVLNISSIWQIGNINVDYFLLGLTIITFFLIKKFKVNLIYLTIGAGVLGYVYYLFI